MKEHWGGQLLKDVVNELKNIKEDYPESENIDEAIELGDRLLLHNYFKLSENILDLINTVHTNKWPLAEDFSKLASDSWEIQYNKDLKEKQDDYRQLFEIIVNNIESWC